MPFTFAALSCLHALHGLAQLGMLRVAHGDLAHNGHFE